MPDELAPPTNSNPQTNPMKGKVMNTFEGPDWQMKYVFEDGDFSVSDWSGYPDGAPKPNGPFKVIEGSEYINARNQANSVNANLHKINPEHKGL